MNRLPREARDGLIRAWLNILSERHPGVTWIPGEDATAEDDKADLDSSCMSEPMAA